MSSLPDANCLQLGKAHARPGVNRLETRNTCESLQGEIDITRIEFNPVATPATLLGGEEGRAAAEKAVEHDGAPM
jgi:hypothetical protein